MPRNSRKRRRGSCTRIILRILRPIKQLSPPTLLLEGLVIGLKSGTELPFKDFVVQDAFA